MGPSTVLMLCEGSSDYEFFKQYIPRETILKKYYEKDKVIRDIYRGAYSNKVVVIDEEGKPRLLKNIPILISKLRSLRGELNLLVIVDCNHDKPDSLSKKVLDRIQSLISNKRKFPKTPTSY